MYIEPNEKKIRTDEKLQQSSASNKCFMDNSNLFRNKLKESE